MRNEFTRRKFFQTAGIATGSVYLSLNPLLSFATEKKLPGMVQFESYIYPKVGGNWGLYHSRIKMCCEYETMTSKSFVANVAFQYPDREFGRDAEKTSLIYHLLRAKSRQSRSLNWCQRNLTEGQLCFAMGTSEMYMNDNYEARKYFSEGIFTSAILTVDDFKKAEGLKLGFSYDPNLNAIENSKKLAKVFVQTKDAESKDKILQETVGTKFKDVKAPASLPKDVNSVEYAMYCSYANLGFYTMTEYYLQNKKLADELRLNTERIYQILGKRFSFSTANPVLT